LCSNKCKNNNKRYLLRSATMTRLCVFMYTDVAQNIRLLK
jgi:hypothetical protein